METAKPEKIIKISYQQSEDNYIIQLKKRIKDKNEELCIGFENDDNECWENVFSHQNLIDLDPIFKKFPDLTDIIDLIQENADTNLLKLDKISSETLHVFLKVKFIKFESDVKLCLMRIKKDDENPLTLELKYLRKELEILKQKKKIPLINYVGDLTNLQEVSGILTLKLNTTVIFHIFIEYKTTYGSNSEDSLSMRIVNGKNKEVQEKTIYKTWHGTYQGGSGYQDSKNVNFMFGEKVLKGENQIILKKKGAGSSIYTLYLLAEL